MNKVLASTSKARSTSREASADYGNQEDYHAILEKEGLDEDQIQGIEKNMILFKSLANIKEQRKKLKEKMKHAQNLRKIKSKVATNRPKSAMHTVKPSPRKRKPLIEDETE